MIIISKHTNQLCNRLFTYLPVLSYAIEAKEKVCFLFQYKGYDHFFPNLVSAGIYSYCTDRSLKASLPSKCFNGMVRGLGKCIHLILMPGEKIPLRKPLGVLFNPKWKEIRYDHAYISKHADRLRHLFAPCDRVARAVKELMDTSGKDIITVGVHLRRGDYATYLGGKYYYSQETYRSYMQQMLCLLTAGTTPRAVRFLLCSNERIEKADFSEFQIIRQKDGDMMVDLYALAQCDYIIGPPSTYSQWASFYGQRPCVCSTAAT